MKFVTGAHYAPDDLYFQATVRIPIEGYPHIGGDAMVPHTVLCSSEEALVAWRVRITAAAEDDCWFAIQIEGDHTLGSTYSSRIVDGEYHQTVYLEDLPGNWAPPSPDFSFGYPAYNALQKPEVSDVAIAYQVEPADWLMLIDVRTGTWRQVPSLLAPESGSPQVLHLVDDHLIWEEWGSDRIRLAHASLTDDTSLFYEVPDADVRGSATDGVDIAWLQGYGRPCVYGCPEPYDRVEIWTAPYVRDPADLRPRLVGVARQRAVDTVVGGHRYALAQAIVGDTHDPHRMEIVVVDLADGRQRRWSAPEPWVTGNVLAMNADEMLVVAGHEDNWQDQTLFRVQLSSLPYD